MNLKEALCAIPDTKHVRITLDGADSSILASTPESQFVVRFQDDQTGGAFAVDGKVARLARMMPADTTITLKGGKLRLDGGSGVYTLQTQSADAISVFAEPEEWHPLPIVAADLKKALAYVQHAAAHNDLRFYLNGVHLKLAEGRCDCVATDGSALAIKSVRLTGPLANGFSLIISNKCIAEIVRLLGEDDVAIDVGTTHSGGRQFRISSARVSYTAMPFDSVFPGFLPVLEMNMATDYAYFSTKLLLEAMRRIDVAMGSAGAVTLNVGNRRLTLLSTTNEGKEGCEILPTAPDLSCDAAHESGVRAPLMNAAINAAAAIGEVIAIGWNSPERALTFSPSDAEGHVFPERWIVMPYRV